MVRIKRGTRINEDQRAIVGISISSPEFLGERVR